MVTARTAVAAADPPPRPERRLLTAADLEIGAAVWVHSHGRWRRGEVTQLARVRVRIRYVSDRHGTRRERWFACSPAEPVYAGELHEPLQVRCRSGRCGLTLTGLPGQPATEIWAAHERSPHHHAELN